MKTDGKYPWDNLCTSNVGPVPTVESLLEIQRKAKAIVDAEEARVSEALKSVRNLWELMEAIGVPVKISETDFMHGCNHALFVRGKIYLSPAQADLLYHPEPLDVTARLKQIPVSVCTMTPFNPYGPVTW